MSRTIFLNARLPDQPQTSVNLLVEDKVIKSIDNAPVALGPDDVAFDCAGRYIMPGLWSCHMHAEYGLFDLAKVNETLLGTEWPAGVLMVNATRTITAMLDTGFTGYIGAGCGHEMDAQLRISIGLGLIDGPRIVAGSRHINNTGHYNDRGKYWQEIGFKGQELFADGPDEMRKAVRREISRGSDVIKLFATGGHGLMDDPKFQLIQLDELDAIVAAAHDRGKKVRAHCSYERNIRECIEHGVDIIDHGDEMTPELIDLMVEHGTTWVPSAMYVRNKVKYFPFKRETDKAHMQRDWEKMQKAVPLANKKGVNLLLGDDFGVNFLPHKAGIYGTELTCYVEDLGIPAADVLKWATVNAAKFAGLEGKVGVLRQGALADIIVVDENPLENIRLFEQAPATIAAVMADGKLVRNRLTASRDVAQPQAAE